MVFLLQAPKQGMGFTHWISFILFGSSWDGICATRVHCISWKSKQSQAFPWMASIRDGVVNTCSSPPSLMQKAEHLLLRVNSLWPFVVFTSSGNSTLQGDVDKLVFFILVLLHSKWITNCCSFTIMQFYTKNVAQLYYILLPPLQYEHHVTFPIYIGMSYGTYWTTISDWVLLLDYQKLIAKWASIGWSRSTRCYNFSTIYWHPEHGMWHLSH